MAVLKLIGENVPKVAGEDLREDFVFGSKEETGAIVIWRVRTVRLGETDDAPLFLRWRDVFM